MNQNARHPTETKAFKRWFRDSAIVGKNGKPLVVYHGTDRAFVDFTPEEIGSRTDQGFYGHGFTFTPYPGVASSYAGDKPQSNVKPVYLSVQRPFDVDAYVGSNAVPQAMKRAGMKPVSYSKAMTEVLRAAGYDGVAVREIDGTLIEVLVFDPTKIRTIFLGDVDNDPPTATDELGPIRDDELITVATQPADGSR